MRVGYQRILAELHAIIRRWPEKAAPAQFLYDELVAEESVPRVEDVTEDIQ